jgi:type I restriction enzyme, S subunit
LSSFELDLPPLDYQERISDLLWAIDAVIQSELLLGEAMKRQLQSSCRHYFDQTRLQNTPLSVLSRDGVLELQTGPFGTVLAASSYTNSGVPVINPVNMNGDSFETSAGPFVSPEHAERLAKYQMRAGDIVMCRKRHVGRMVRVRKEHDGFILGSDCIRLRAQESRLHSDYLLLYLRSDMVQQWLVRSTSGSVMPGMNEAILAKLEVPVPEIALQEKVTASLEQIRRAVERIDQCTSRLLQVRQALQDEVFALGATAPVVHL